jgi:excinuclease ABC subunit B
MREAAADLDFEEAARLRDEIKRLRQTELAVVDNPTARQVMVTQDPKLRRATSGKPARGKSSGGDSSSPSPGGGGSREARGGVNLNRPHKPVLDEMGIATWHEFKPARKGDAPKARSASDGPRKPNLDEMGPGVESVPARKGEGPRSTMGRPGQRGGFKKRGR